MSEGFDPQALLARALEMSQQLAQAQDRAGAETVEGSAGGGSVKVTMTGAGEVTAVRILPSVVLPEDVELLEDLILAALHDAAARVGALADASLGGVGIAELFGGLGAGFGTDGVLETDAGAHGVLETDAGASGAAEKPGLDPAPRERPRDQG